MHKNQYYLSIFLKYSASLSISSIRTASLSLLSPSYLLIVSISASLFLNCSCNYAIFFWFYLSWSSNYRFSFILASFNLFSVSLIFDSSLWNWVFCCSPRSINVDRSSLALFSSCVSSTFLWASPSLCSLTCLSWSCTTLLLSTTSFLWSYASSTWKVTLWYSLFNCSISFCSSWIFDLADWITSFTWDSKIDYWWVCYWVTWGGWGGRGRLGWATGSCLVVFLSYYC